VTRQGAGFCLGGGRRDRVGAALHVRALNDAAGGLDDKS
jgi:hypothetical protein